jgi:hypothetical protein
MWASAAVCREAVAADSGAWALAAAVDFAAEVLSRKQAEETARCVHLGLRLRAPYHCYVNDLFTPIHSFLSQSQRRFGAVTIKKIIIKLYYYYLSKLTGYDPLQVQLLLPYYAQDLFSHPPTPPFSSSVPETLRRCDFKILYYYYIIPGAGRGHWSLCEFGLAS